MSGRSGVIVRIRLPPELEELRQHHDPMAPFGVPAHVTLLYPFLPSAELTPAVRRRIARLTRDVRPFDVRFERTGRFPGAVWLAPGPAEPIRGPDRAPRRRVPGVTRPTRARTTRSSPTSRLGSAPRASSAGSHGRPAPCPPFRERVRAIEVIAESGTDRWHRRWRIPLGPAAQARSTAPPGSPRTVRR